MELLRNGDCRIYFDDLGQFALSAEKVEATLNACPNVALYIDGQDQGQRDGQMAAYTLASHFALKNCLKNSEETVFIYEHDKLSLRVEVSFLPIQGTNAFRMHTVLLNQGEEPITSSLFSSAFIQGIGLGGKIDWTRTFHPIQRQANLAGRRRVDKGFFARKRDNAGFHA